MLSTRFASAFRAGSLCVSIALMLFGMVLLCVPAMAQVTADILGTVTDHTGGVIPNATVTVKNLGTNLTRTQQTSSSGQYSFTLLPLGTYSVAVEAAGFKTYTNPQVTLATGERARVDV